MEKPFVLVIDDNRQTADSLVEMLTMLEYPCKASYGPRGAMEYVTQRFPGLVFIDIHMPGVDGLEVCRHLRRDPRTVHVPIIIISSDQQPDLVRRAYEAGANHFLLKPLTLDILEQTLTTALKGQVEHDQ